MTWRQSLESSECRTGISSSPAFATVSMRFLGIPAGVMLLADRGSELVVVSGLHALVRDAADGCDVSPKMGSAAGSHSSNQLQRLKWFLIHLHSSASSMGMLGLKQRRSNTVTLVTSSLLQDT